MRITRKQARTLAALMPGECDIIESCTGTLWAMPDLDDSIRSGVLYMDIRTNGNAVLSMRGKGEKKYVTYEQTREAILESEAMQDA